MKKKNFVKPVLSIKNLNVQESIVASIEIFDNGYIGGNYETTYYKRNAEGGITGDPGTQAHGCFDYLTGGPQINLNEINNNWDFNIWVSTYIFDNRKVADFTDEQKPIYNACVHFK
jgi:hypothetical protein